MPINMKVIGERRPRRDEYPQGDKGISPTEKRSFAEGMALFQLIPTQADSAIDGRHSKPGFAK